MNQSMQDRIQEKFLKDLNATENKMQEEFQQFAVELLKQITHHYVMNNNPLGVHDMCNCIIL